PVSVRRRLRTYPRVPLPATLRLGLALIALLAPWIALHDPIATDPGHALLGPGAGHPLGTDELGRDLFARVVWGSRVSLPIAFVAVAVVLVGGGSVGLLAGYRGGLTDLLLNLLNPLIVQISLSAAMAMRSEATLSFLGLGAQPPIPDWGFMMNTGAHFLENDPWLAVGPGLAISLAVFGFNWLGDALRDA